MPQGVVITIPDKANTPQGMYRNYQRWSREVRKEILLRWWQEILPKHFTPKGENEYGYKKRGWPYTKRKMRKMHHRNPLEWTGKLKQVMLRRMPASVVTKGEARLTFRGAPRHTFITSQVRRTKDGKRTVVVEKPDMRSELVEVSQGDFQTMLKWFQDGFNERMSAAQRGQGAA